MNDAQVVIGLLGLIMILEIYCLIKAWHKKRLRYELKKFINGLRPVLHLIGAMYILILGIIPVESIRKFAENMTPTTKLGEIVVAFIPTAWKIILLIIVVMVAYKGTDDWVKYSDKEKEWRKEERVKFKEKLPIMLKWVVGKVE